MSLAARRWLRALAWMAAGLVTTALVAALLLAALAESVFAPSRDEVARNTSPGGQVDAVVVEINGGATTSFAYEVYVVPKGRPAEGRRVAFYYGAVRSEQAYGINLQWLASDALRIAYLQTQRGDLERQELHVAGQLVRVQVASGVSDPAAPPGGMLYNLQPRR